MHNHTRVAPFERLTVPAALWYFLALLLVAATVMQARVELEILAAMVVVILLCGERRRLASALVGGTIAGLFVAMLTLLLHYQGDDVLVRWGPVTITAEGAGWAVCLGLGMVIIVLSSLLQTFALRRSGLVPGLSRLAMRTTLVCAMAIAIIPSVAARLRQLFALEEAMPESASGTHFPRLRILTYAILAETLEDASNRVSTLALLGTGTTGRTAQRIRGGSQEAKVASVPGIRPEKSAALQPAQTGRARRVRSWCFALVVAVLFALILLPGAGRPAASLSMAPAVLPDVPAIILTALPLLFEGGERLWSRSHA